MMKAILALEDGICFEGISIGAGGRGPERSYSTPA